MSDERSISLLPETQKFLDNLEIFAQRKFQFRTELGILIEIGRKAKLKNKFDELTFLSKFVSNAYSILKRHGSDGSDTSKLLVEFQTNLEKSAVLLRELVRHTPVTVKDSYERQFLDAYKSDLNNLILFLYELSWIKNYSLDVNLNL